MLLLEIIVYSCYYSSACSQILFCFQKYVNEAIGSIQCQIDPFRVKPLTSVTAAIALDVNNSMHELFRILAVKIHSFLFLSFCVVY